MTESTQPADLSESAPAVDMRPTFSARVMALQAKARQHRECDATISEATYAHGAESGGASWSSVKSYTTPLIDRAAAAAIAAEADALAEAARGLRAIVQRYLSETPLGHQPHMIASEADAALAAFDKAAGGAA